MRRFWIHNVLPLAFAAVPVLAAALLFAAIPPDARRDYLNRVAESPDRLDHHRPRLHALRLAGRAGLAGPPVA